MATPLASHLFLTAAKVKNCWNLVTWQVLGYFRVEILYIFHFLCIAILFAEPDPFTCLFHKSQFMSYL